MNRVDARLALTISQTIHQKQYLSPLPFRVRKEREILVSQKPPPATGAIMAHDNGLTVIQQDHVLDAIRILNSIMAEEIADVGFDGSGNGSDLFEQAKQASIHLRDVLTYNKNGFEG
jgi:hypothetical protein